MEQYHRKIIMDNIKELMNLTDYETLMNKCIGRELLNLQMQYAIEDTTTDEQVRHRMLLEKITRRGPQAFAVFVSILRNCKYRDAADILDPPIVGTNSQDDDDEKTISIHDRKMQMERKRTQNLMLAPYTGAVHPKKNIIVTKSTKFYYHPKIRTYRMESRHRGVFFCTNIIQFRNEPYRKGAIIDRDNLITLFRDMEFDIFYYENISYREFMQLVNELKASEYLRRTDCLVFTLLTHGASSDDKLYAKFSDGSIIAVSDIISNFNNINCRKLINKPKIFIFPFCWGNEIDPGVNIIDDKLETDGIAKVPSATDIKILYGTVPGHVTYRHPQTGSWYLERLCEVFAEHAHDTELDDMVKMIGAKVLETGLGTEQRMTPSDNSWGFFKALYFNPGYYKPKNMEDT